MKPLHLTAGLQLLAAQRGKSRRFRIEAYSGGKLSVDGFDHPVIVDLAGLTASAAVPICLDHQTTTDNTIGQTSGIANDGKSLVLSGEIIGLSAQCQRVLAMSDAGYQWQASIGCTVEQKEVFGAGVRVIVNGQTFTGPVIVARSSVLRETSILPMGADSSTVVNLAARAATQKEKAMMTFEQWIAALGIDHAKLADDDRAALLLAFDAKQNPTPPAPTTPPTMPGNTSAAAAALVNLRAAANHQRIGDIERLTIGHPVIAAKAIEANWSAQETEIAVLRANQKQTAPANHIGGSGHSGTGPQHLTASLMTKAGFGSAAEKMFGASVMEQSRRLHAQSLPDLCRAALIMDGREVPHDRGEMLRAALSTGSMPVALGDSANKILSSAYRQAPASWRSFASVKPASNFKVQHGIRPSFGGDLSELGSGGEIKHGTFAEEVYDWDIDTFAKMISIDRKQIVNDDASMFSDVVPGLARAAARTLNALVIKTLLANASSFFGSGNANYFSGATTNLSATSLATAIQMLRQMKDREGNLLDLQPAVLLVPPELEQTALALIKSSEVQRVATGDQQPTGNTFKDIALVAVEPRLSDASFAGSSAVAWYLFSEAVNASVIVGFLDGNETPVLEQFGLDHDINVLAYGFRVYHDFGCALADFRAAIRSKGSA